MFLVLAVTLQGTADWRWYRHLTIISDLRVIKNNTFPCGLAHYEIKRNFSLKKEHFTVWISELCPVDAKTWFSQFLPWHCKRQCRLPKMFTDAVTGRSLNQTFPRRNISMGVICISWKLWGKYFFFETRAFYCLNQRLMSKRAAKSAKRASCEI